MASRNFGNVKAAAVKRHPGSNITGVTNFERGLQLLRTPQRSQTPLSRLARTFSTARSQALGGAAGSLETRDADYVGGVAGTCTGSASLRRLATAAYSARAEPARQWHGGSSRLIIIYPAQGVIGSP